MARPHHDIEGAIRSLLLLRQLELETADQRERAAAIAEFLESLIGPTVRPATGARLLQISSPSLMRWIEQGDVATVLTPEGRREIPLAELLSLLEEVDAYRANGALRPLSRVIQDRGRRAEEAIDIRRLLPPRRGRSHRVPELQSLAYHRLVAERLDDKLVDDARRRLERWRAAGRIHPTWADRWSEILELSTGRIARAISADTNTARELRQTSPFVGVLTEQERRRLVRAVEERALA